MSQLCTYKVIHVSQHCLMHSLIQMRFLNILYNLGCWEFCTEKYSSVPHPQGTNVSIWALKIFSDLYELQTSRGAWSPSLDPQTTTTHMAYVQKQHLSQKTSPSCRQYPAAFLNTLPYKGTQVVQVTMYKVKFTIKYKENKRKNI